MRSYAAYVRAGRRTVLVKDGFSLWALLFGPFWLLIHAAWIPAALVLAAEILVRAAPPPVSGAAALGLALLVGLHGNDLRGWSLRRRGFRLEAVVAARGWDAAYARLLTARPELVAAEAA